MDRKLYVFLFVSIFLFCELPSLCTFFFRSFFCCNLHIFLELFYRCEIFWYFLLFLRFMFCCAFREFFSVKSKNERANYFLYAVFCCSWYFYYLFSLKKITDGCSVHEQKYFYTTLPLTSYKKAQLYTLCLYIFPCKKVLKNN